MSVSALLFAAYTRDAASNTVYDDATNLIWQDEPYTVEEASAYIDGSEHGKVLQWANAIDYCEALDFAGQSDWRLPNFNELYMITDDSTYGPAMHMSISNGFVNVASSSFYWSSTTVASDTGNAWSVHFYYGVDYWYYKTDSHYVRCVRDGQIAPLTLPFLPAIVYYLLQ